MADQFEHESSYMNFIFLLNTKQRICMENVGTDLSILKQKCHIF
jgi:hypothetical protein